MEPTVLYRIAALPDEIAATLAPGTLTGDSKQRVLAAIGNLRRIVLKWPAWATPGTQKEPTH